MQHPVFAKHTDHDAIADIRRHVLVATMTAAERGVPLAVTLHGAESIEEMIAEPIDVVIDDAAVLTVTGGGKRRVVALAGPDAPAILPSLMPCDSIRERMIRASGALADLRRATAILEVEDGHGSALMTPDMVMVASTGIYPAGLLGIEWDEGATIDSIAGKLSVRGAERSLVLRAA